MDQQEEVLDADTKRIRELAEVFWSCKTYDELDQAMDMGTIEKALRGLPDDTTELLVLYLAAREKISRGLDYWPEEALDWEPLRRAAIRLGAVYLFRSGYLLTYEDHPEGMSWALNPLQPIINTLEVLKERHEYLYRLARVIFERENLKNRSQVQYQESPLVSPVLGRILTRIADARRTSSKRI